MCKKLIYLTCFVLMLITSGSVQAEPFSLGAVEDIELGNDTQVGPDASTNGSGLGARDIAARRRVVLISYDISALKSRGQFSNVSFSHFSHDQHGETNVYGIIEDLDLLEVESLTWNTTPGVQNNPTPDLSEPVALDFADLTDVLLTFSGPGSTGVRFSTDTSEALADFLNSDTDGIVTFLFAPGAENNQLIIRSSEHAEGGSFLEGELSPTLEIALNPSPANEVVDVLRDVVLSWTPGEFADKHNVYLGTNFDDVNDAGSGSPQLVGPAEDANSYNAGRLEFDQTYYWRVDEVSAPPDNTIYKGNVWQFTVESLAYQIPAENIMTSASSSDPGKGPENTINGSGLDESGLLHGNISVDTMWLSSQIGDQPTWIEYEFDKVYKLHQMWVWNSNDSLEPVVGLGFKDVTIEYSVNGFDYTTLETVHEFARAPGLAKYVHNTTVDFNDIAAKYIKLTANSNWEEIFNQFGLSEVRFFQIPVHASESGPDSGAVNIALDVTLNWRAGREADEYNLYFSDDEQAVIDGTALFTTLSQTIYGPMSLDLGKTYYWRVDEVNNVNPDSVWAGDIWNFTTTDFLIVDDFEDYNDWEPDRIFDVWLDGWGTTTNGAEVGYANPDFPAGEHHVETTIVHSGNQSAPIFYDNSFKFSEADLPLSPAHDWTEHGVKVLLLYFHGAPSNTVEQMYVKVNGTKVGYDGDPFDIIKPIWKQWSIELASVDVDLQNVTELSIGFGDEANIAAGGPGVVFIDEIVLAASAPAVPSEEVWVEAEANNSITAPMMIYNDPNASGGQYVSTETGTADEGTAPPYPNGTVSIPFTVEGGTYTARFRIGFPGGDDSCWVRIQDATITSPVHSSGWIHFNDIPTGDYWHWSQEVKSEDESGEPPVEFTLSAGTHNLEISYRGADLRIDAIVFSKID